MGTWARASFIQHRAATAARRRGVGAALGLGAALAVVLGLVAGCQPAAPPAPAQLSTPQIRQLIQAARPGVRDSDGWAGDMRAAFTRLDLPATRPNVCAAIAVVAQESGFVADPEVPQLADITLKKLQELSANPAAWAAINIRLRQQAAEGRSYYENLQRVRTEQDLERWYQAFVGADYTGLLLKAVGKDVDTLISTLGSMQVSVHFARDFARASGQPVADIRQTLYTRAGGLYYGIAHLLKYDAHYSNWRHVFADYNAGHYASRNAGFQRMVSALTGSALAPDGDLLNYAGGRGAGGPSATSRAVLRLLADPARPGDEQRIMADLRREKSADFSRTDTWRQVAERHRQRYGRVLTEAMPSIRLHSDKISRALTTEWFANRVGSRFDACMAQRPRG